MPNPVAASTMIRASASLSAHVMGRRAPWPMGMPTKAAPYLWARCSRLFRTSGSALMELMSALYGRMAWMGSFQRLGVAGV